MHETTHNPWMLYDEMIAGIPQDIVVTDYCLGVHWSCVAATCGAGVAYTVRGGSKWRPQDMRGMPLFEMAKLAKSWSFEDATLGIAALNAYYSQPERPLLATARFEPTLRSGATRAQRLDPFALLKPVIEQRNGKAKVVVVGHFPHVAEIAGYAELTVLERNCRDGIDVPDPGCEYVLPQADFLFTTGVTLANKTAPRLLSLARGAHSVMVGPSAVPSQVLFDCGLNSVAGRVVTDPEEAMFTVKTGNRFNESLRMFMLDAPENR